MTTSRFKRPPPMPKIGHGITILLDTPDAIEYELIQVGTKFPYTFPFFFPQPSDLRYEEHKWQMK